MRRHQKIGFRNWYYGKHRICELLATTDPVFSMPFGEAAHYSRLMSDYLFGREHDISDLGALLKSGQAVKGRHFTVVHDFYGCSASRSDSTQRKIWCNLKFAPDYRLDIKFNSDNLTSSTARSELAGRIRAMFVFAYIGDVDKNVISAHPYIIADVVDNPSVPLSLQRMRYGELGLDQFDAFSEINKLDPPKDTKILKSIKEEEIKRYFAEIIGEPVVPKDWGGEKSDLFSDRVLVNGKRMSAAFCFKGPAVFKKMHISNLGKNGDQIIRLFEEPADILIVQHCCTIASDVRAHMRSMANQAGKLRNYAVIDGYDTVRILQLHNKIQ